MLAGLGIGDELRICVAEHNWHRPVAAVTIAATVAMAGHVVGEEPSKEHLGTLDCPPEAGRHHLYPAGMERFLRRE